MKMKKGVETLQIIRWLLREMPLIINRCFSSCSFWFSHLHLFSPMQKDGWIKNPKLSHDPRLSAFALRCSSDVEMISKVIPNQWHKAMVLNGWFACFLFLVSSVHLFQTACDRGVMWYHQHEASSLPKTPIVSSTLSIAPPQPTPRPAVCLKADKHSNKHTHAHTRAHNLRHNEVAGCPGKQSPVD